MEEQVQGALVGRRSGVFPSYVGGCLGHEGGGSFFVVVELIGHLLLPPSRKSMFRKSMGSGDNGKPHKRSETWERTFARKSHAALLRTIYSFAFC